MNQATLSFNMSATEISIEHNNRTIPVPHSDVARQRDNYYWQGNQSLARAYENLFASDVAEYNARQKRADRKIGNYLEKVTEGFEREKEKLRKLRAQGATLKTLRQNKKAVKPTYEFIVTIGNMHDNPEFNAQNGERKFEAKEIMQRYILEFAERYNGRGYGVEMYNASIHLCENGQVHCHIDVIFHSNENTRGMQHQVSLNKALNQMGYFADEHHLAITKWEEHERAILTEMCAEHGIEVVAGKGSKKHLHKEAYILEQEKLRTGERSRMLDEQEARFDDFLIHSESGNAFLLLGENDALREELTVLQAKEATEQERLSQMWQSYKTSNSEYWARYSADKDRLKKEIALAVSQKRCDRARLRELFRSVFEDNSFILTRLFRLLSALFLKFKIDREEQQLQDLQIINKQLKDHAKIVCDASKATAEALKSKDFERIGTALQRWEDTLSSVHANLEGKLEHSDPEKVESDIFDELR